MLNVHDIIHAREEFKRARVHKSYQLQASNTRAYLGVATSDFVANELDIPVLQDGSGRGDYSEGGGGDKSLVGGAGTHDGRNFIANMVKDATAQRMSAAAAVPPPGGAPGAGNSSILARDVTGMMRRPTVMDTEAVEEMEQLKAAVEDTITQGGFELTRAGDAAADDGTGNLMGVQMRDFMQQLRDVTMLTSETYSLTRGTVEKLVTEAETVMNRMMYATVGGPGGRSMFNPGIRSTMKNIISSLRTRLTKFNLTDNPSIQAYQANADPTSTADEVQAMKDNAANEAELASMGGPTIATRGNSGHLGASHSVGPMMAPSAGGLAAQMVQQTSAPRAFPDDGADDGEAQALQAAEGDDNGGLGARSLLQRIATTVFGQARPSDHLVSLKADVKKKAALVKDIARQAPAFQSAAGIARIGRSHLLAQKQLGMASQTLATIQAGRERAHRDAMDKHVGTAGRSLLGTVAVGAVAAFVNSHGDGLNPVATAGRLAYNEVTDHGREAYSAVMDQISAVRQKAPETWDAFVGVVPSGLTPERPVFTYDIKNERTKNRSYPDAKNGTDASGLFEILVDGDEPVRVDVQPKKKAEDPKPRGRPQTQDGVTLWDGVGEEPHEAYIDKHGTYKKGARAKAAEAGLVGQGKKRKRGSGGAEGNDRELAPEYDPHTDRRAWRDQMPASEEGSQPRGVRYARAVPNTGLIGREPGHVNQYRPSEDQVMVAEGALTTGIPGNDKQSAEVVHQMELAKGAAWDNPSGALRTQPYRMNATRTAVALRAKAGVGPAGAAAATRQVSTLKKKRFDSMFKALGAVPV